MAPTKTGNITIRIDPDLHERLRRVSEASGISQTRLIEDGLQWRLPLAEKQVGRVSRLDPA